MAICLILSDVRHILRYGWRHFVKNIFITKGLGKENLTLPEIFEYTTRDDFEEACKKSGEKEIRDALNKMKFYDRKD